MAGHRKVLLGVLYGENRPKSENWEILTPCSSATVRRTRKVDRPRKLTGPWTTTRRKQCLCSISRDL